MTILQNSLLLDQSEIKSLFDYKEGKLFWKKTVNSRAQKGQQAGSNNGNGYCRIRINKKSHYAHRLIFMFHYGYCSEYIDHINGNVTDNKIKNLREATQTENNYNMKKPKHNTTGAKCVYWFKPKNKWKVQIGINKKSKHIGYFDNFELAELVANEAREKYHGEFARTA